jgi:hypothetical protein
MKKKEISMYLSIYNTYFHAKFVELSLEMASKHLRAALHQEVGPNPLEADCMQFQPFLGWRPASSTHYNKIITGSNLPISKGLRAKKVGRFNKSSIIQRI